MKPIPYQTRWVRRDSFIAGNGFTVGGTYKIKEWISKTGILVLDDFGNRRVSDSLFWEVDQYMENLERHILT